MKSVVAGLVVIVHLLVISGPTLRGQSRRPATLKDFFRSESIDAESAELSPDGQMAAYTQYRPLGVGHEASSPYEYSMRGVLPRNDVWIISSNGRAAIDITHGDADGASFWKPEWSPDGQRLMMLSTRGGRNKVHIWVWNRTSERLTQLSSREIEPEIAENVWLTNSRIFFVSPLQAAFPMPPVFGKGKSSRASSSGAEEVVTASVIESGNPHPPSAPDAALVAVDADTRREQVICTTRGLPYRGNWNLTSVSPNRGWVAFLEETGQKSLRTDEPVDPDTDNTGSRIFRVRLANLKKPAESKLVVGSEGVTTAYEQFTLSWSPDSTQFVIASYASGTHEAPERLRRCEAASDLCKGIEPGTLTTTLHDNVVWYNGHQLLAKGKLSGPLPDGTVPEQSRELWWKVNGFTLSPLSNQVAGNLLVLDDGSSFLGIVDGAIWKINLDGKPTENLTPSVSHKITRVIRFSSFEPGYRGRASRVTHFGSMFVFQTDDVPQTNLFELDMASRSVTLLKRPRPTAGLIGLAKEGATLLFSDVSRRTGGNSLWLTSSTGSVLRAVIKDKFTNEIAPFKVRFLRYKTLDGKDVWASVTLPPGYMPGERYPTVVIVYPGSVEQPDVAELDNDDTLSTPFKPGAYVQDQLLAIHGYAVMKVSMPNFLDYTADHRGGHDESVSEPYNALANGVLPALDVVVKQGIADPNRIGLIGGSYGGYAVYGLVTQTSRFKAAVDTSGFCDLVSLYGTGWANFRYGETFAGELSSGASWDETVMHMGMPPWRNMSKYLRNSPIAYAGNVETPLMIVDGDMDGDFALQQGEEFFTALKRENKRVEFIRYWGEGHNISSPANAYDEWQRIYAWFDEFLKPSVVGTSTEAQ